ncbi:MAG: diadenylate cyclase CdaA [Bradymonadales bacterium]|nr:diadenylate cyclase CdaA [Bradymonadales bacterium]
MIDQLQQLFQIHSIWDLFQTMADIILVSYVIYRTLNMIRGTKAVPVLIGLFLVLIAFFATRDEYLGLTVINWLLEKFMAAFILLVIVIFQEDIRRGLAVMGRSRMFQGLSGTPEVFSVEEIVKACVNLSSARLGGLIVIEREADLTEYSEEGIRLDARISQELLFSLFNPSHANPTHDGAVIIQRGKVTAAGCFLPLTSNPRVHKSLGTRHRAGIGLSEKTDAVVCIVSEETGTISIAYEGNLTRKLDANHLRERLQYLLAFQQPEVEKKGGWSWFKIFSAPLSRNPRKKTSE